VRKGSTSSSGRHRRIGARSFPANVLLTRIEQGGKVVVQATVSRHPPSASGRRRRCRERNPGIRELFDNINVGVVVYEAVENGHTSAQDFNRAGQRHRADVQARRAAASDGAFPRRRGRWTAGVSKRVAHRPNLSTSRVPLSRRTDGWLAGELRYRLPSARSWRF